MQDAVANRYPYYARVPKERRANLLWRLAVCRRAMHDAEFRADIVQMCADDPLFFINGFCWGYDPREEKARVLPFILRPKQEQAVCEIKERWGKKKMVILKSRSQGASYILLFLERHSWLFDPMFTCGLISRDEASVDERDDASSLMGKLDFIMERLPCWIRPEEEDRIALKYTNLDNRAITRGYAANKNAGRSGRTTVFIKDESAFFDKGTDYEVDNSIEYVTNCQIDISTPNGDVGSFADKCLRDSEIHKIILDWKDNPSENRGLYQVDNNGQVQVIDPQNNPLPPGYWEQMPAIHQRLETRGFTIAGTTRSPWYNAKCLDSNPVRIAQELDMSFGRSAEKAFERKTIDTLLERHGREPLQIGYVQVVDGEARFRATRGGTCKLWSVLGGPHERPPKRAYGAGADVAFGTGGDNSSNSVLIVGDLHTGEQVFEFASPAMRIPEFARLCVAVCKWFWNATLNWDSNGGAGGIFTQEVLDRLEYFNVTYSEAAHSGKARTPAKKPGTYRHDDESKAAYLTEAIEDALADRNVLRSKLTINEFGEFGFKLGRITHLKADRTLSEGAKGKAHGDRATAAAMWNIVRRQLAGMLDPVPDKPPDEDGPLVEVPWSCMANRLIAYDRRVALEKTGRRW
jgi:hypothetical protein